MRLGGGGELGLAVVVDLHVLVGGGAGVPEDGAVDLEPTVPFATAPVNTNINQLECQSES